MYFDLSVPIPGTGKPSGQPQSKKFKGKQPQPSSPEIIYSALQITALENRIDLLIHLGYSVIAFNQIVHTRIDPKTHINAVDHLLGTLRKRVGVIYLKRLTIVLDENSEKGFGLTNANVPLVQPYDILSLVPTTQTTFSLACLNHSLPSALTCHIISLPLTLPRLPFHLKHTLVRTAIKNGAVFEIGYAGALGGDGDAMLGSEGGPSAKRNWWAAAREVVRVAKGKGIVVSGSVTADTDLRAPRDIANLITLLGLAQNQAHDASTTTPKSLVLRAQTRQTYRAILSEPKVIFPPTDVNTGSDETPEKVAAATSLQIASPAPKTDALQQSSQKRPREADAADVGTSGTSINKGLTNEQQTEGSIKKKKKNRH